ncbi:T9SS type A sorting domain-containing protein [candidate division KSB1 bacterium]|nr:T9SS type A sorting domain-containing protein [candidate division KSB1 bacterium]
MKRWILICTLIQLISMPLYSQQGVNYDPPFPTAGDRVKIIFYVEQNWQYSGTLPATMVLHWGINGRKTTAGSTPWEWPDMDILPSGSITNIDNNGNKYVRSPMLKLGNRYEITIQTNEKFKVLNFVIYSGTLTSENHWYHDRSSTGGEADWAKSFLYSWQPYTPNHNDTIRLTVRDCTQGGSILWSVLENGFETLPDSRYWPGDTQIDNDIRVITPLSAPDANDECHLELGPFTSGRQIVEAIRFQMKRYDGTIDSIQYSIDFDFNPIAGDPIITFLQPDSNATLTPPIPISVTSENSISLEIWINGDSLFQSQSASLDESWEPEQSLFGSQKIACKATSQTGRVSFKVQPIFILPVIIREPAPEAIIDGATVSGNQVNFALFAPGKNYVALKGSFNTAYPEGELMKLSGDTLWWLTKTIPNGDYTYQFNLEGKKSIADPWSKNVEWIDPVTGQETWDAVHTKTELSVGAEPFQWTDDGYAKPALRDLIIYEMHLGDFSGEASRPGTYHDLIEKIEAGYFDELGITAVELMPINEFEGSVSWGYNPSYHMAPESSYGTPDDLKLLVDTCHRHGIAVILDVVFNHAWGSSALWQLNETENGHDTVNDHYFNGTSIWGYKLEHWREVSGKRYRAWKYISEVLRTWIQDYHIDGFRYDVSHGVGWDHTNIQGMAYYVKHVHQLDPTAYNICEDFPSGATYTNINASPDADAGWHADFHWRMKDVLVQNLKIFSDIKRIIGLDGYLQYTGPVNYTVSHDERRVIYELRNTGTDYAVQRTKMGSSILMTSVGLPMIFNGQEFAQNSSNRDANGNPIPEPLTWYNLNQDWGQDIFNHYKRLTWLRRHREVLRSQFMEIKIASNVNRSLVYWRNNANEKIVVAANFNTEQKLLDIPFPANGEWYEYVKDDTIMVADSVTAVSMAPSEVKVFANFKDWESLPTAVHQESESHELIYAYSLEQNYPNPFNPETNIRFSLEENDHVTLEIYNMLGQKICTLVDQPMSRGIYNIQWQGKSQAGNAVASGIYVARIKSGNFMKQIKMLLLR